MRVTRLGAGVDRTGRLDPEAIERTLAVMRDYRQIMDRYQVAGVRIAATSASRDAANRDDFFGPATEILGRGAGADHAAPRRPSSASTAPPRDLPPIVRSLARGRHRRRVDGVRPRQR